MPTNSPLVVSNAHPGRNFDNITQIGLKALDLAQLHASAVQGRLPAGVIEGLQEDLRSISAAVPAATHARIEAMSATEQQNQSVEQVALHVSAVRRAVWSASPAKDVRHAYGVGSRFKVTVPACKVAVNQILSRLELHPEEAAAFGILPGDIAALTAAREQLSAAASAQDQKRASAPSATKARNATANRILRAAKRIAGAGVLAFATDPVARAEFASIKFGAARKKKGAKSENKAPAAKKAQAPAAPAPTTPAPTATTPASTPTASTPTAAAPAAPQAPSSTVTSPAPQPTSPAVPPIF